MIKCNYRMRYHMNMKEKILEMIQKNGGYVTTEQLNKHRYDL